MQIVIKFPEGYQGVDVQPFVDSERKDCLSNEDRKILDEAVNVLGKIEKIGYRVFGNYPLVSIEKKDGYLYVEIDEREVISCEKVN